MVPTIAAVLVGLVLAMSPSAALTQAKKLFGPLGNIAEEHAGVNPTVWMKQVGVKSPGCHTPFTVLGQGLDTWEAAFYAVPAGIVQGPYSGFLSLDAIAWDEGGVASFTWLIDGVALVPDAFRFPAEQRLDVSVNWDTKSAAPGIHVLCGNARDAEGNVGRTRALVVRVDQTQPSVSNKISWVGAGSPPSVPVQ